MSLSDSDALRARVALLESQVAELQAELRLRKAEVRVKTAEYNIVAQMLEQERWNNQHEELPSPAAPVEFQYAHQGMVLQLEDHGSGASRSSSASPYPFNTPSSLVSAPSREDWTPRSPFATPHGESGVFSFGPQAAPLTERGNPLQSRLGSVVAKFEAFHGFADDFSPPPGTMTRIGSAVRFLEKYLDAEDIMWTLAHASLRLEEYHSAMDAVGMSIGRRELTALLQVYLSHSYLLDEPLWLSEWKRHVFPSEWSMEALNALVFHFFETQGFSLQVDDKKLQGRMKKFTGDVYVEAIERRHSECDSCALCKFGCDCNERSNDHVCPRDSDAMPSAPPFANRVREGGEGGHLRHNRFGSGLTVKVKGGKGGKDEGERGGTQAEHFVSGTNHGGQRVVWRPTALVRGPVPTDEEEEEGQEGDMSSATGTQRGGGSTAQRSAPPCRFCCHPKRGGRGGGGRASRHRATQFTRSTERD
uniref:Uncharacterized protein n=1 Tax=Chromera velia CCMP2878 TaxID=1169474 RepID=A0A0G4F0N2_9ALVE|eukprot:Cvel_14357.t1-p1 / transcript=Cvel_14357.t1 / gene=Cvel_14357 / organism=Chromera_velia_CCMP2878 / gene_product=hypothetical protein / transcript_product=hypothetical protein / location=Cvel_scaffold1018:16228-18144(+) / protein_length=474 / sequence_SO=supercontig / SO=protein_coding / is_pseudo=false